MTKIITDSTETFTETINTGRDGGIEYSASNLLDIQLMEALKSCLQNRRINHSDFLNHLERLATTQNKPF